MQDRATDSNTLSSSGAQWVKLLRQKAYRGFLISSMKVMRRPHCMSEREREREREREERERRVVCQTIIRYNVFRE